MIVLASTVRPLTVTCAPSILSVTYHRHAPKLTAHNLDARLLLALRARINFSALKVAQIPHVVKIV